MIFYFIKPRSCTGTIKPTSMTSWGKIFAVGFLEFIASIGIKVTIIKELGHSNLLTLVQNLLWDLCLASEDFSWGAYGHQHATFWFWRARGKRAHLGLPEAQCSHIQVEAVFPTDPHTAFEIASHLFLYLQNTNYKMSVRFVVSRVTSHTSFCLQASLAVQTWLLNRRSCKSWVLLTEWSLNSRR